MRGPRRPGGRLVALEGPSGVGKSAVVDRLSRAPRSASIREAYDRLSPRPSLKPLDPLELRRVEERLLREEGRRYGEALRLALEGRTVYLDTGFLGPLTYAEGLAVLDARWNVQVPLVDRFIRSWTAGDRRMPDRTVYLDAPRATVRSRALRDPAGHPAALIDRHLAVAGAERDFWRELASVLPRGRVIFVRATGSLERVARTISSRLDSAEPGPVDAQETRALFRFLAHRARVIVKRRGPSRRLSP